MTIGGPERPVAHLAVVVLLITLALCLAACARAEPLRPQETLGEVPAEGEGEAWSPVVSITTIKEKGGRLDWSPKLDLIAFDRRGEDGYYDVYVMRPDGSSETCLTCDRPGLPQGHMGNPAWHPSGDYMVFQAEKPVHSGRSTKALPGYGIDNDIWLITRDGKRYYQLTDTSPEMGVLHPHFSHDGSKLLWAEKVGEGGEYGVWALKVADFIVDESGPHLVNVQTYQPGGKVFHESHGFSPDDTKIIFSGNLEPGQREFGIDIYTLDLITQKLERLTSTLDEWDEHAQYSPSGKKIVWMSTMGCKCNPARSLDLRADYWLMNADGSDKVRLTYFNEPGHAEYTGERIVAADSSWGPNGTRLAALLIVLDGGLRELFGFASLEGRIVMITFDSPQ